jgi:hypothetical protein
MKKIYCALLIAGAVTGCMKKVDEIKVGNNFASVAVINAAPTSVANSLNGNVYVNGSLQTAGAINYRGSSGYLAVRTGSSEIRYVATTLDSARFIERTGDNFEAGKSYTYVIYDTVATTQTGAARRLKSIRLNDDLTLSGKQPNAGYIRVLHLAPLASAIDVTFLRTNVTPSDSVTVANRTYIGSSPAQAQIDALSTFSTMLPLGFNGNYTIKVKQAGTQTVLATLTSNLTTQTLNQSFVTVYVTGGVQGQPVSIGVFRHYP